MLSRIPEISEVSMERWGLRFLAVFNATLCLIGVFLVGAFGLLASAGLQSYGAALIRLAGLTWQAPLAFFGVLLLAQRAMPSVPDRSRAYWAARSACLCYALFFVLAYFIAAIDIFVSHLLS